MQDENCRKRKTLYVFVCVVITAVIIVIKPTRYACPAGYNVLLLLGLIQFIINGLCYQ